MGDSSKARGDLAQKQGRSSGLAMPLREILLALHLDEARGGAFELEGAVAGAVEVLRLGVGGSEQFDLMLVERVDQSDEAGGLVAVLRAHARDADQDDRVIMAGHAQIV